MCFKTNVFDRQQSLNDLFNRGKFHNIPEGLRACDLQSEGREIQVDVSDENYDRFLFNFFFL